MKYAVLFLISIAVSPVCAQEKYVIGARPFGFFSNFFGVINNLDWCEKRNIAPVVYWDRICPYHEKKLYRNTWNAWEYYFYPVSSAAYASSDRINNNYTAQNYSALINFGAENIMQTRYRAHELIEKYIKALPYVQEIIDQFYDKHMKGNITIGIHMRGTDKNRDVKQTPPEKIIQTANEFARNTYQEGSYQFLVATDEQKLLDFAREHLCGPVIYYDAVRSGDNTPIHINNLQPARIGLDILVETLLLSLTNFFIHTSSNVSAAVLGFNPRLVHNLLTED